MANASQIPNLLDTLRASKATRAGRSRAPAFSDADFKDTVVQQTDDDASGSRLSAVEAGYLEDAFARTFHNSQERVRRMPIMNRGTYVRTTAIDLLVNQFLNAYPDRPRQIVSVGAGSDTRFFRLLASRPHLAASLTYHELDFPATTVKKIRVIEQSPALLRLLRQAVLNSEKSDGGKGLDVSPDKTSLISSAYTIQPVDLRALASPRPPQLLRMDPHVPTLLLSEMCLTYLATADSTALLKHVASTLVPAPTPLYVVLYEPLHPHDAFGQTMVRNLSGRGILLPGLSGFPTLEAQMARLREVGFAAGQCGFSVREIWDEWVDGEEKERLRAAEGLDEEEEWVLLAGHYGVVWGWRGEGGLDGGG